MNLNLVQHVDFGRTAVKLPTPATLSRQAAGSIWPRLEPSKYPLWHNESQGTSWVGRWLHTAVDGLGRPDSVLVPAGK